MRSVLFVRVGAIKIFPTSIKFINVIKLIVTRNVILVIIILMKDRNVKIVAINSITKSMNATYVQSNNINVGDNVSKKEFVILAIQRSGKYGKIVLDHFLI